MKKLVCFIFLVIVSCKSFKDYTSQKVTLTANKSEEFSLDDNQIIIPLTINNKRGNFIFDTGAMKSVLTDNEYVKSFTLNKENYYTAIKVKGATGEYIKSNHFISDSITSKIIKGEKNIFRHVVFENKKTNCSEMTQKSNGIIGFDIFKNAAQPIILDFENNNISVLNNEYSTEGFSKLEAKIQLVTGNKIIIPFIIDGDEVDFLFDTGNNGGFLMNSKDNKISEDKKTLECETLIGSIGNFSIEKIKMYKNVSVEYNIVNIKTNVSVFPKLTTNTVGIEFIKHFNWILDFNNGAIYLKQIKNFKDDNSTTEIEKDKLKCIALENKLIIGFKNLMFDSLLNAGDEIIAVNNETVTPENICQIQDLLNKTENWNALNIEVKK